MATKEENERLTRIGAGTAMGDLLRRYWQPVGTEAELAQEPVQRVRILGEDLTLFRTERGEYGLIEDRCPHRCMSLEYGIPEECGLRCAYHGWMFDTKGNCIEQPFEEIAHPEGRFKDEIKIKAYPCASLGGLVFAYFGPAPAPLLSRWDVLLREDLDRVIEIHVLPCNWLQCMDNAADPVHFEFLHARFGNYQMKRLGKPTAMAPARHVKIAFDLFKYGIMKRRLLEGEPETSDEWTVGHPLLFPNILAVGGHNAPMLQYRVPIDDTRTIQFGYRTTARAPGAAPRPLAVKRSNLFNEAGKIIADNVPAQDMTAWVGQGAVSDRTREHLATSDRGVALYHKLLVEQMDLVARGEEPMALVRDPAENQPMIDLGREQRGIANAFDSRYGNYFEQVEAAAEVKAK
ncbi:MAG TPA: Rieske 2Fe-2S domain-containing protein [Stellaceae bacterium]|jgi:5,5'-dehydrodivanillate O-demethylase|nr:Rieske 2Fe-2S domain-containing protein [Stellaceae bacterium]